MMERGRAARAFEAIANALLERAVPRAREALRERFGPDADLSTIRLEGREVHVEDTRATIAERTQVHVSRASFRVTAEPRRPLYLASLEGVLTAGDGLRAPLRFVTREDVPDGAWIAGTLTIESATWPRVRGEGDASLSGAIDLEVGATRWSLESTSLASDEATMTLQASGDVDAPGAARVEHARVELTGARAGHVLDLASAIAGERFGEALALLRGAKLAGVLRFRGDTGATVDLSATTEASSLRVRGDVTLERTLDATIDGSLALHEALSLLALPPEVRPHPDDRARCDLRVAGSASAPRIFGTLHAATVHAPYACEPLRDVKLDVDVSSTELTIAGTARASDGTVRVQGATPLRGLDPTARVDLDRVPLALFAASLPDGFTVPSDARASGSIDVRGLAAFAGPLTLCSAKTSAVTVHLARTSAGSADGVVLAFDEAPRDLLAFALAFLPSPPAILLPPSTQLTGELTLARGSVSGDVALETESTALLAKVRWGSEGSAAAGRTSFEGTTVRGRLAARDLIATGLVDAPVRPIDGVAAVDARVIADALHATLTSDALALEAPGVAPLPLQRVAASLVLDPRRLVFRALRCTLHGGELSGEGLVSFLDGAMQWRARGAGVALERIALAGGRTSMGYLRGALAVDATLGRPPTMGAPAPLYGHGELRVDHPIYEALSLLAPKAARHGITLPSAVGVAPLGARFSFGEVGVRFEPLDARLDGATATGFVTVDWSGALGGRVEVRADEKLLRGSPLGLPAMLTGSLRATVNVRGTVSDPKADVDPLRELTTPVAEAFDSVTQAVSSFFGPLTGGAPPRPSGQTTPQAPPTPPSDLDRTLDRILDHDPASESLVAELVDRGIDPDEFSRLSEQRRRARRR